MHRFRVAVDFDGVLHRYTSRWVAPDVIPDQPVEGAIVWLNRLCADPELEVVIHTTRARTFEGQAAIKKWLLAQGFTGSVLTLRITDQKIGAHLYIDDRGYCFTGANFPTPETIKRFQRWGGRPPAATCLCGHGQTAHSPEPDTSLCFTPRCDCIQYEPQGG